MPRPGGGPAQACEPSTRPTSRLGEQRRKNVADLLERRLTRGQRHERMMVSLASIGGRRNARAHGARVDSRAILAEPTRRAFGGSLTICG